MSVLATHTAPYKLHPAVARPPESRRRRMAQTSNRRRIEAELKTATRERPITAEQVAARTGIDPTIVRTYISNLCAMGHAHNTTPRSRPSLYATGPSPDSQRRAPPTTPQRDSLLYDGHDLRPNVTRPGAMDAFALPSLRGNVRVPHRPPVGLSSNVREVQR